MEKKEEDVKERVEDKGGGRGVGGVWRPALTDRVAVQFPFTRRV